MVPFFVLAVSVFSPSLLNLALAAKGATVLAGCVGIFFVLGETLSPRDLRRPAAKVSASPESLPD
ncbi:hypothetical protein ALQ04_01590 [Pseudomonas cichorii]|uniref:Uncharacterized protein n=1 Tax=Pseudomonas cichorii TaxID=36746 RepID=A0A3M4LXF0_PSECI|nr:hypothetical protein [Pseudomonas cichorii]RMQ45731.1 hypothetical protein ALQ04_01590 [Pseudomonas cichorii]